MTKRSAHLYIGKLVMRNRNLSRLGKSRSRSENKNQKKMNSILKMRRMKKTWKVTMQISLLVEEYHKTHMSLKPRE